ncbi:MAG: RNA-binding transcriptional accessory protein [Candidatus Muirbacterium halophilum]|nr:RNA-binding transcriptional accessory protein [Candidatus Muirbacterium halophilum]MCK9476657.1 RNA-binding transcriptional accessory protein [Candidatus Muirbacterium halophilum]
MEKYYKIIANELNIQQKQVVNTAFLFDEGNTLPFIARYRKEITGNLDETYIKSIGDKVSYFKELEERKKTVIQTIEELGKMTDDLRYSIDNSINRTELEDIYLPYKPKKTTRATKAKEAGLEPLSDIFLKADLLSGDVNAIAQKFINVNKGIDTVEKAIDGAKDIIAEKVSEDLNIRKIIRENINKKGLFTSFKKKGTEDEKNKFENYSDFSQDIRNIPSHRIHAMLRGENEKKLNIDINFEEDWLINNIETKYCGKQGNIFENVISDAVKDSFKRLVRPSMVNEFKKLLKERADIESISVFSKNLRAVLMESPLGQKNILAVDPGIRTGAKLAILSNTGDFLKGDVLFWNNSSLGEEVKLVDIMKKFDISYIAIGNGTGSREVHMFINNVFKKNNIKAEIVIVNESGASIYSASDTAREEFPELDLTLRGAISIGRRLQDPLSELVKIDPKSIGVGQYQHDVEQSLLKKELDEVVVSCVNSVGVNANTASHTLLRYVAGLTQKTAKNIVNYREEKGSFKTRKEIKKVPGIGPKAFEQAAGFLRVVGKNPLDNTGVHPEHYYVVEKICSYLKKDIEEIIANPNIVDNVDLNLFIDDKTGIFTLKDIKEELKKPGRDPRSKFENVVFDENIREISDLKVDMILPGKITNITKFGAFCDIGVHQDGLIHISEISDKFIKEAEEVLKVGQIVKVKVLEVEKDRKRISLSIKKA